MSVSMGLGGGYQDNNQVIEELRAQIQRNQEDNEIQNLLLEETVGNTRILGELLESAQKTIHVLAHEKHLLQRTIGENNQTIRHQAFMMENMQGRHIEQLTVIGKKVGESGAQHKKMVIGATFAVATVLTGGVIIPITAGAKVTTAAIVGAAAVNAASAISVAKSLAS